LEDVDLGGVVVDAMEDGADHVGQFQGVGGEDLGLIDGEVDEFFEGFDVSLTLLVEEILDQLLYISHLQLYSIINKYKL
jgi:hypothetical protein